MDINYCTKENASAIHDIKFHELIKLNAKKSRPLSFLSK